MRTSRIVFIGVLLLLFLESIRLWLISPTVMAIHFNAPGIPDRYAPKVVFFSYQLITVLIITGLAVLMQLLLKFLPIQHINIPNRDFWLSPDRRPVTMNMLGSFLDFLFAATLLVVHAGFEISTYANLQKPVVFSPQWMAPFIIGYFILAIGMLLWLTWEFRFPRRS